MGQKNPGESLQSPVGPLSTNTTNIKSNAAKRPQNRAKINEKPRIVGKSQKSKKDNDLLTVNFIQFYFS